MTAEEPERESRWRTARRWIWDDPDEGQAAEERAPLKVGPALRIPAARIHNGSAELGRRWGRWIWPENEERQSVKAAAGRVAVTGLGGALSGTILLDSPALMWPATIGWCVVAYRTHPETEEPADAEDEAPEPEAEPESEPGPSDDEFVQLVRELIGDGPGIHLAELPPALAEHYPGVRWDTDTARALVVRAGLPIRGTRSATRTTVGSSTGIRAKDLPPLPPSERAPEGVVAAGQPTNNNTNNSTTEPIGQGGYAVREPAETAARRHVA